MFMEVDEMDLSQRPNSHGSRIYAESGHTRPTESIATTDAWFSSKEVLEKRLSRPEEELNVRQAFPGRGSSMIYMAQQQNPDPTGLIDFDGPNDPGNPRNWTVRRRVAITAAMSCMTFVVTFSSSVFVPAVDPVATEFGTSHTLATLGVSFYLLGFVFGPIAFGPASEIYGRRLPLMSGYMSFALSQVTAASARDFGSVLLARLLGGFSAAAPLAVVGGALVDIWEPIPRAYGLCAFAAAAFTGPVVGPIVGSVIVETPFGWRFTFWLTLGIAIVFGIIGLIVIPETSASKILQVRACKLRHETKNWAIHAKADEVRIDARSITTVYLVRPFVMITREPILALITGYMSVLYGIIYLFFEAFPISFHEERGWSVIGGALPFFAFILGIGLGTLLTIYSTATNYRRAFLKHGRPVPEQRLPIMIIGAIVLPIALFWFGWTSNPSHSWVPQVVSVVFLGFSSLITFWPGMNYLIDCYGLYTNSALAANTFFRSIVGAAFPLFAPTMFRNLGVPWASSVLAFVTIAFLPAPVLFYKYGERIRQRSRFVPSI